MLHPASAPMASNAGSRLPSPGTSNIRLEVSGHVISSDIPHPPPHHGPSRLGIRKIPSCPTALLAVGIPALLKGREVPMRKSGLVGPAMSSRFGTLQSLFQQRRTGPRNIANEAGSHGVAKARLHVLPPCLLPLEVPGLRHTRCQAVQNTWSSALAASH